MQAKSYYITTTLPYVNAEPHIGFGLEILAADVLARFHRLKGKAVIFNTGTDEHGQKIYQKAIENNLTPQDYADQAVTQFQLLDKQLDLSVTNFIRTTDANHIIAAQEFWQRCQKNGDIYLDHYQVKYCVGCELAKLESELVDNACPLHPNQKLELRDEENYFFRFSRYQNKLMKLYTDQVEFVKPVGKLKEISAFVSHGLQDFSISRLKDKMPWGIPVPGDGKHVMYVWFDALVNYLSTLGWPNDEEKFKQFWPGTQIAGKDNLRQQAAMWQAMLLSADLPPSKQILINGFISVAGQKMSKSLNNVISPKQMITKYGVDATRWLLLTLGPIDSDMDISFEQFDQVYTAQLANGLGNLCSRVAQLAAKAEFALGSSNASNKLELYAQFDRHLEQAEIAPAVAWINLQISQVDQLLSQTKPWLMSGDAQKQILSKAVTQIISVAYHAQIFIPQTANRIISHFQADHITKMEPLFPRL